MVFEGFNVLSLTAQVSPYISKHLAVLSAATFRRSAVEWGKVTSYKWDSPSQSD